MGCNSWSMKQSVDVRDDASLLDLIAQQRDENAFSELFTNYKRAAYSLALNIVGDARIAEEVLQEGMLRVWSGAGKFRSIDSGNPGSAKAWIMKIIAREAFRALQRKKKRSREVRQEFDPASLPMDDAVASTSWSPRCALKLDQLTADDRQLIALHYGGGLSQTEISESLSIPQQTISHRINRALKDLRAGLASAGFASVTAVLAANLTEAVSTGYTPPAGLSGRLRLRSALKADYTRAGQTAG